MAIPSGWQCEFLRRLTEACGQKLLLLAPPGSGKTSVALHTVRAILDRKLADVAVILTAGRASHAFWVEKARAAGVGIEPSVHNYQGTENDALCETAHSLRNEGVRNYIGRLASVRRMFMLVDEIGSLSDDTERLMSDVLLAHAGNKALLLSSIAPSHVKFDAEFRVGLDFALTWSVIEPDLPSSVVARGFSVTDALRRLAEDISHVDHMPWRHFERIVAALLEDEGYDVELMRGSKDGGIDVVAVKSDLVCGYEKLVVQVKRKNPKYRVDIRVVRELSAVQMLNNATKGLIVTSTFLTRDALALVEREKAHLAKVDRDDLATWIRRASFRAAARPAPRFHGNPW